MRKIILGSYTDFLDVFFERTNKKQEYVSYTELNLHLLKFAKTKTEAGSEDKFSVEAATGIMLKTLETLKKQGKHPIIVIDELQKLKELYFNGGKELLEELFNFFVTITKSGHLAHVICMSSDSLFIDEVYNNSILEKTSKVYLLDSFDKKTTVEWLAAEGVDEKAAGRVFDKVGGECWYLQEYLRSSESPGEMMNLKKSSFYSYLRFCDKQKRRKIVNFLKHFKKEESLSTETVDFNEAIMRELVSAEILFYDPLNKLIKPQSRLMLNVLRKAA